MEVRSQESEWLCAPVPVSDAWNENKILVVAKMTWLKLIPLWTKETGRQGYLN